MVKDFNFDDSYITLWPLSWTFSIYNFSIYNYGISLEKLIYDNVRTLVCRLRSIRIGWIRVLGFNIIMVSNIIILKSWNPVLSLHGK